LRVHSILRRRDIRGFTYLSGMLMDDDPLQGFWGSWNNWKCNATELVLQNLLILDRDLRYYRYFNDLDLVEIGSWSRNGTYHWIGFTPTSSGLLIIKTLYPGDLLFDRCYEEDLAEVRKRPVRLVVSPLYDWLHRNQEYRRQVPLEDIHDSTNITISVINVVRELYRVSELVQDENKIMPLGVPRVILNEQITLQ